MGHVFSVPLSSNRSFDADTQVNSDVKRLPHPIPPFELFILEKTRDREKGN
jgi:hypothetical protein